MEQRIKAIQEAFSSQAAYYGIGTVIDSRPIERIEKERRNFPINGDPMEYDFYVGYDKNNQKIFEFRAETCNVFYAVIF